jgi:hypothetical protein
VTWRGGATRRLLPGARYGLQGPDAPAGARGPEAGAESRRTSECSGSQGFGSSPSQSEIVPGGLVTPPGTTDLGR